MEQQFQITQNGQEFRDTDANLLGETSALADDRTLAELLRMAPYTGTVIKAILPHGHGTSGKTATVQPSGAADGAVKVNPFRAIIGARTAEGTDAKKAWRDIRGVDFFGSTTAFQQSVTFGAAPANARWDLIYAQVTVDANSSVVTRYVKNPTTKVVSAVNVSVTKVTSVTLAVQAGTDSATPVMPAVPADGAGVYNIPIAYVRISSAYGGAYTFTTADIALVAKPAPLNRTSGALAVTVADQQNAVGGTVLTAAQQQTWGGGGARPKTFMPSDVMGGDVIIVEIDQKSGTPSHVNGDVVDSRDWRGRFFLTFIDVRKNSTEDFAQNAPSNDIVGDAWLVAHPTVGVSSNYQFGQSLTQSVTGAGKSYIANFMSGDCSLIAVGAHNIGLYVDQSDGKLKAYVNGSPAVRAIFYVFSFGVHSNV